MSSCPMCSVFLVCVLVLYWVIEGEAKGCGYFPRILYSLTGEAPIKTALIRSKCCCGDLCLQEDECKFFQLKPNGDSFICSMYSNSSGQLMTTSDSNSFYGIVLPTGCWRGRDGALYWSSNQLLNFFQAVDTCAANYMTLGVYTTLDSFNELQKFAANPAIQEVWVNMPVYTSGVKDVWADGTLYESTPLNNVITTHSNDENPYTSSYRYHYIANKFYDFPQGLFKTFLCQLKTIPAGFIMP